MQMQRAAPPWSRPPPGHSGNAWSAEFPRSSAPGCERWCRCSLAAGASAPAGIPAGPETAPCCWGWSRSVYQRAATPSPPTGSSCGDWGLDRCWSSWSDGSLIRCPTEAAETNKGSHADMLWSRNLMLNVPAYSRHTGLCDSSGPWPKPPRNLILVLQKILPCLY